MDMIWWGIAFLMAIGIVLMVVGGVLYFLYELLSEIISFIFDIFD